eukprot:TRINITY_DN5363_c0_g4_i1.p2 TRINITY_DN5363_c0_g4~~TRINITY_DN5363_c0_g4_i1.p2  ORF type:complete len:197 (-),score=35.20 TRINITY_DN5363_c0_g4_i1:165-755(-)
MRQAGPRAAATRFSSCGTRSCLVARVCLTRPRALRCCRYIWAASSLALLPMYLAASSFALTGRRVSSSCRGAATLTAAAAAARSACRTASAGSDVGCQLQQGPHTCAAVVTATATAAAAAAAAATTALTLYAPGHHYVQCGRFFTITANSDLPACDTAGSASGCANSSTHLLPQQTSRGGGDVPALWRLARRPFEV